MEEDDSITEGIIGCCFEVHRELGPGFREFDIKQKKSLKFFIWIKGLAVLERI